MYVLVWRFRPAPGRLVDFERAYGPDGPWVRLFSSGAGYLGTELFKSAGGSDEFLCVDRWESEAAWLTFRSDRTAEYRELDRAMEALTAEETLIGQYVAPAPAVPIHGRPEEAG